MGWRRTTLCLVLYAMSGAACFDAPDELRRRYEQTLEGGEAVAQSLDELEERLLADQARLHLWSELAVRRRQATEVACTNQNNHWIDMQLHAARQAERARQRALSATPPEVPLEDNVGGPE